MIKKVKPIVDERMSDGKEHTRKELVGLVVSQLGEGYKNSVSSYIDKSVGRGDFRVEGRGVYRDAKRFNSLKLVEGVISDKVSDTYDFCTNILSEYESSNVSAIINYLTEGGNIEVGRGYSKCKNVSNLLNWCVSYLANEDVTIDSLNDLKLLK